MTIDFLSELHWRGMFNQCTDEPGLRAHLASGKRRAYIGFDPTADSLTIGNMVTMMLLVHFQRAGHTPVVVMGGGTGLIGDPSGKSAERQLQSAQRVQDNVEAQRPIFTRLWENAGLEPPRILNNIDWLSRLSYIDVLRDVGKYFSVNMMIQKDSVRDRLNTRDQGISYTEFSYILLQAYDFAHLFRADSVSLQMGGSDQWGNIVGGVDLIRRMAAHRADHAIHLTSQPIPGLVSPGAPVLDFSGVDAEPHAFGLTTPLVTKADGGKFGKTESGAIWMTPERTSAYAIYQFWLNTADTEVIRYLKVFTLLTQEEIAALEASHAADPGKREAQRALARAATALMHGDEARDQAESAAKALFSGELAGLSLVALNEVLAAAPTTEHSKSALEGEGLPLIDLLPLTSLATSKSQARQYLTEGAISINGAKAALDTRVTMATLLHNSLIALRRGKKHWHVTRWS